MAPRAQGADPRTAQSFRYPPSVHGTQLGIAVFIGMFWEVTNESVPQVVDEIVDVVRLISQERVCRRTWSRLSMSTNHRSWKK